MAILAVLWDWINLARVVCSNAAPLAWTFAQPLIAWTFKANCASWIGVEIYCLPACWNNLPAAPISCCITLTMCDLEINVGTVWRDVTGTSACILKNCVSAVDAAWAVGDFIEGTVTLTIARGTTNAAINPTCNNLPAYIRCCCISSSRGAFVPVNW